VALARRGAPAAERAHHVLHAARHGDMEAVEVLQDAGRAAAGRAPSSAARWFEAALRLLPPDAPAQARLDLLIPMAGALATTGQLEAAHPALLEGIRLSTGDSTVPRVHVIAACAGVEQLLGRPEDAHRRLIAALEEAPESSPERASVLIDLTVDAFYGARFEEMRDRALEAVTAADGLGEAPLHAAATALCGFALSLTGPIADAESTGDRAAAMVDGLGDGDLAQRLDAAAWLSSTEFYLDRYEAGRAHAERGLAIARATGQGELIPALTQAIANLLFMGGEPVEAGELLDGAVDAARLTDNAVGLAWSLLNRSYAAVNEGDIETATAAGEEAVALTDGLVGSVVGAWAGATLCAALLESGEPGRAVASLTERGGGEDASLIPGAWRATWLGWMTRGLLELNRLDDARRAAELARVRADEFGLPLALAAAAGAEARIAEADGEHATAAKLARAAAADADRVGATIEAAHWRALAGRALAAAGASDEAIAELERAAKDFDGCRAYRYRDQAERELGKLGRRRHRRSRRGSTGGSGVNALTGREREIAELVVDRRTNPQIAAELFLSVKTVETHMGNIFRKLDVSSRVEVARVMERATSGS